MAIEPTPLPFREAIAYWSGKVPMSESELNALAQEMRRKAFTLSNVTKMEILTDIYDALSKAIGEGESLGQFKGRLKDIMQQRGWEGLHPWHAELVYRNNLQTAYSTGRYQQMMASTREYWMYHAIRDLNSRPEHAANHGKVYRRDHPFWNTWYPPNGHG